MRGRGTGHPGTTVGLRRAALLAFAAAALAPPAATAGTPAILHGEWAPHVLAVQMSHPLGSPLLQDDGNLFDRGDDGAGAEAFSKSLYGELGTVQHTGAVLGPVTLTTTNKYFPTPGDGALDPTVAAGTKAVAVSEAHYIQFLDRSGHPLAPRPGGLPTQLTYDALFAALVAPKNPDGTVNQNNINRHLKLGSHPPLRCDATKVPTYPSRPFAPTDACVNEFYDARVLWDRFDRRFVAVAQARNTVGIWTQDHLDGIYSGTETWRQYFNAEGYTDAEVNRLPALSAVARRYLAFAVSRSADPRDGFTVYIMTRSNYADWPIGAVSNHLLLMTHLSQPESGKPALYAIALQDLANGSATPHLATAGMAKFGNLAPFPAQRFDYSAKPRNRIWLVASHTDPAKFFAMPDLSDPTSALAQLSSTSVTLPGDPLGGFSALAGYAHGRLCLAAGLDVEDAPTGYTGPDLFPRNSIRLLCVPLSYDTAPHASTSAAKGYRDKTIGLRAPSDAPTDRVSYEVPALAMNRRGDVIVGFARRGVHTAVPLDPEARYSIMYAAGKGPRRSALLEAGQAYRNLLPSQWWHTVDLTGAALDPTDNTSFWVDEPFITSNGGVGMAVAHITP